MDDKQSIELLQYQVVASRRQGTDSMMWQAPALSLTAQAFLFTIALDSGASLFAKVIAASLALVASLASIQLMAKHRHHELTDSIWLEDFEQRGVSNGFLTIHKRRVHPAGSSPWSWFIRMSSYRVWLFLLVVFAVAACIVLLSPLFESCCNQKLSANGDSADFGIAGTFNRHY